MSTRRWSYVAGISCVLGATVVVWTVRRAPGPATVGPSTIATSIPSVAIPAASVEPAARPVARVMDGGERSRVRRQLVARLGELRSRVAVCGARERGGTSVQDGKRAQETVLTLDVVILDAQMQVVDADVLTPGSASGAFIACAQSTLRGQVLPAPAAKPGARIRMPLRLGFRTGDTPD